MGKYCWIALRTVSWVFTISISEWLQSALKCQTYSVICILNVFVLLELCNWRKGGQIFLSLPSLWQQQAFQLAPNRVKFLAIERVLARRIHLSFHPDFRIFIPQAIAAADLMCSNMDLPPSHRTILGGVRFQSEKGHGCWYKAFMFFHCLPCSLRLALLNEAKEVRAAGLRALRYLIGDSSILQKVLKLKVDYLIAR